MNDKLKKLVFDIAQCMCDKPECLTVEIKKLSPNTMEIVIKPHSDDLKFMIGKNGKNIQSVRNILFNYAMKFGHKYYIHVN
jgi:predicted RNA-binding protein YlqC (UPF0109 family)